MAARAPRGHPQNRTYSAVWALPCCKDTHGAAEAKEGREGKLPRVCQVDGVSQDKREGWVSQADSRRCTGWSPGSLRAPRQEGRASLRAEKA